MLKVLLINPRSKLPIDVRSTPHLGLAYLGAVSLQRGDDVQIYDAEVEKVSLSQILRDFAPDVVGITANTSQVTNAWRAATAVKQECDAVTIFGGPHVSALPEESARKAAVDVVVRGEGEATWLELCNAIENVGKNEALSRLGDIAGITYRDAAGTVQNTPERPPIADLDKLPMPAYDLFKMERYSKLQPTVDRVSGARSFSIMTSRGCPYRCKYCSQSIMPLKWRMRSPESVVAEWRHLVRERGAEEIGVLDDSFNINRRRVHEICELLIAENLNHVPWIMINGIRANLANTELLAKMKMAGCKRTAFGVESGNQAILDSIDKHLTIEQVRAAFRAAKEVGMETIGFFMIGLPGETEETMNQTIDLAIELDPVVANFSMTTPFPGTKLYDIVKENGHLLMNSWDEFVFFEGKARYEMGDLTAELMERKWKEAHRRFYLRPSRVIGTLLRPQTWLDLPRTVRMAWNTIFPKQSELE